MRRRLAALSLFAAVSLAVGLVAAGTGAGRPYRPQASVAADSAPPSHLLAGFDAFRSVVGNEADHVATVAPSEPGGAGRLLLLLAVSLVAQGLLKRSRPGRRPRHSTAQRSRTRARVGVGLRAPPSTVLA